MRYSSAALEVAGAALLALGAFIIHPAAGLIVAGLALVAIGYAFEPSRRA